MLKNHLNSAYRNLLKHKGFTLIHVGGLAIGLTAAIFILHYARLENAYDEFHSLANRIFRVSTSRLRDGIPITDYATTFSGVSPALQSEYAEIEASTRMFKRHRGGIISYKDKHIREMDIIHADAGFFDVFSFQVLHGARDDLFLPGAAFIEEKMVRKYFGNEDPLGKRITFGSFNGVEEYEVRGVIRCPENSSIKFNFIFNYHDLNRIFGTEHENNWQWLDFHTFITLKEGVDFVAFQEHLKGFMNRHLGERAVNAALTLQPLTSLYLQSKTQFETGITGDETTVKVLIILGIIILAIVVLNFINLSTSRSLTRAKEVGIRKVLGSSRQHLIQQFLIETMIINLLAGLICIVAIALLLPHFNQLTNRQIDFSIFLFKDLWKYMTLFFLVGTLTIGLYPALTLSSFKAVDVLKGFFSPKAKGSFLRETFVGFQALVSFSLVASILVIIDQVNYVNKKNLGIDINQTLVVRAPDVVIGEHYLSSLVAYKNSLLQDSRVISVTTAVDSPGAQVEWIGGTRKTSADPTDIYTLYRGVIDEDFFETFGAHIISGKMFTSGQSDHDVIINRQALNALRFSTAEESLTQQLLIGSDTFTIIGVVEGFHQVSPREAIAPTVYHYNLETPRLFLIKYSKDSESEIIKLASNLFQRMYPNVPFDYYFLDQFFDTQYDQERRLTLIVTLFCILAVVVSSLGLLGLTWFRLARQKKELAVRKIIGSSDWLLFVNASRRLIYTTLIGCAIGIPLTWYVMNQWLETFSYHTHPRIWQFGVALASSLFIALVSISGHTLKVIKSNPVLHLRQD